MASLGFAQASRIDDAAEATPFGSSSRGEAGQLNFRQVFGILWRGKFIIVAIMILFMSFAYYWVQSKTPLYVSTTDVEIGIRDRTVLNVQDVLQQAQQDFYYNDTQASIIRSAVAAETVAEQLDLYNDPSRLYWGTPDSGSLGQTVKAAIKSVLPDAVVEGVRSLLDQFRGSSHDEVKDLRPTAVMSPEVLQEIERQNIVKTLLRDLVVDPSARARTISISFLSDKPAFAREVAQAFATTYVNLSLVERSQATSQASDFIVTAVERQRDAYESAEKALEAFRREAGVVEFRNQTTLLQEQRVELNRQRIEARERAAEAAARVAQVERLLLAGDAVDTVTSVLDSPLIVRLREQEAEIVRDIAELRTQLRDRHPKLQLKRAELEDLQKSIRGEIDKIVIALKNDLELANVKVASLDREIATLQTEIESQTDAEVTMRRLESERNAQKQLYDTLLNRNQELLLQEQTPQQANARIITPANLPIEPSYPRKNLTMAAAFLASGVLGIMMVFLREFMDTGFRSLQQLQQVAYVPALGLVPRLSVFDRRRSTPEDFVIDEPNSLYSESIRTIRTALMLASMESRPRSVMFTSSVPAEGKTSTAVSVARASAKAGQRTIIIDCDLRKPSVHESLQVPNQRGVVDVLSGAAVLDDVIEIDLRSGLHYITAGPKAPNPPDALGSLAMRQLIDELTRRYDLVIIDTPPVLPVSDALVLLRNVDKAVYLVRWGSTRREAVLAGIRQVQEANGDLAGVAMTRVDINKHQKYNYSDSYYYYRGYGKYYGN